MFLEYAKELGLDIWLYDDFNWPSGHAAGTVTVIEAYRLKSITVKGENVGKIRTGSTYSDSLFGEKHFPDLLSKEAVDCFIELSFAVKRCMISLAACFKVDHYFLAVAPMDLRGNGKIKNYFNCFTADQPDFGGTALLAEDEKSRLFTQRRILSPMCTWNSLPTYAPLTRQMISI